MITAERVDARTVPGLFLRQAERLADRPTVHHYVDGRWEPVTWARMRELATNVAIRLIGLGVDPGDRVILMSENRLEWLYADLGIMLAGAVSVPVYPSSTAETVRQIAANSEAKVAIVAGETIAGRFEGIDSVRCIVRMDLDLLEWTRTPPSGSGVELVESRVSATRPEDMATVIYTSGTTGEPKGVVLEHRSLVDMAHSSLRAFDVGEDDVSLSFLPYAHVFERVSGTVVGLASGASGYISRGVDHLVEDIGEVRPTLMISVPRVYEKMFDRVHQQVRTAPAVRRALFHWALRAGRRRAETGRSGPLYPLAERLVLSPLRTRLTGGRLRYFVSGGAPLARDVEEFFWAMGVPILQGWGMTETASGATSNSLQHHRYGTVGRAMPGVQLRIAEDGEVLVKGPGIMREYFRRPDATAEVLEDGWLHTGDVGHLDKEGFLTLTDRKKDLIKTAGGKYVAPQPIEARLQQDEAVERAVVIGDSRPFCVALIVPEWDAMRAATGAAGDPETLVDDPRVRAYVQARVDAVNNDLGSWETIKAFAILAHDFSEERGEMTPTLKVKRKVVMEHQKGAIEDIYASARQNRSHHSED